MKGCNENSLALHSIEMSLFSQMGDGKTMFANMKPVSENMLGAAAGGQVAADPGKTEIISRSFDIF